MQVSVRQRGFTVIELVVSLAIVGVLALVAMPSLKIAQRRHQEAELRESLRTLRQAIDRYKQAADGGLIAKPAGSPGYPPSLEALVDGVDAAMGAAPGSRIYFLRRLPRDPFAADAATPAAETWALRSYASSAEDFKPGADVFDLRSRSTATALDGTRYDRW